MASPPDDPLKTIDGFEWDSGNAEKNWANHSVRQVEAEQVILNRPLVYPDVGHSDQEARFKALGETSAGKPLTVVFTRRGTRVRVISARPMSRVERKAYVEAKDQAEADS